MIKILAIVVLLGALLGSLLGIFLSAKSILIDRSFRRKWGVSSSEGTNVIVRVTEGLINEGEDWDTVIHAARRVMNDLWLLKGQQAKILAIVKNLWERRNGVVALMKEDRRAALARLDLSIRSRTPLAQEMRYRPIPLQIPDLEGRFASSVARTSLTNYWLIGKSGKRNMGWLLRLLTDCGSGVRTRHGRVGATDLKQLHGRWLNA
jgi:hypothetical protein